jgi:hypothetical protein
LEKARPALPRPRLCRSPIGAVLIEHSTAEANSRNTPSEKGSLDRAYRRVFAQPPVR